MLRFLVKTKLPAPKLCYLWASECIILHDYFQFLFCWSVTWSYSGPSSFARDHFVNTFFDKFYLINLHLNFYCPFPFTFYSHSRN